MEILVDIEDPNIGTVVIIREIRGEDAISLPERLQLPIFIDPGKIHSNLTIVVD